VREIGQGREKLEESEERKAGRRAVVLLSRVSREIDYTEVRIPRSGGAKPKGENHICKHRPDINNKESKRRLTKSEFTKKSKTTCVSLHGIILGMLLSEGEI